MKRFLKLFVALLVVILLCGCGLKNEDERTIKCSGSQKDLSRGYEIKSEYNIYAKGKLVDKVKTKEMVTSDNESILSYFETTLNSTYEKYDNEYGGYKYQVTREGNTVTSDVEIDYSIMDMKKFIQDNTIAKSYVDEDNSKFTVEGLKRMYKSAGATCED